MCSTLGSSPASKASLSAVSTRNDQVIRRHSQIFTSVIFRLQAMVRGVFTRNDLRRQALAAVFIQTAWRKYVAKKHYNQIQRITLAIQSIFRGRQARAKFVELRANETPLIMMNASDLSKKKLAFEINKVHSISLNQFNVSYLLFDICDFYLDL
jgi:hypothetical protein